jgi:exonuclease SbcD
MTRLLHTGDWHLGRYLHGVSLLEDQRHVLDQLIDLARSERVDAVLVAGDVYDRSVPPADAVALLDEVLARLVVDAGIPVVLIAGNHDSPDRIGFGARILGRQGLFLRGTLDDLSPVRLADAHGELAIHPLPFVEPVFARALPGAQAGFADHQGAMAHAVALLRAQRVPGQRNVLVGHAFVAGGSESDSERPLSVGGSGRIAEETFEGFDFVALGHLHRPQTLGGGRIHYAGSLLKYSFNEVEHVKGVSLVDIDARGVPTVRHVPLAPRRDVRIVTGTLAELLQQPDPQARRDDYLCAHLTDAGPVLDPMARLREVYPNMMEIRFARQPAGPHAQQTGGDHRGRQPDELFRAFYRDMLGEELGEAALQVFQASVQAVAADAGRSATEAEA